MLALIWQAGVALLVGIAVGALLTLARYRAVLAHPVVDQTPPTLAEITSDHADDASQRAFSLIVNGLGNALKDEQWMPLSERVRISEWIYDTLVNGGVEIRRVG